MGFGSIFSREGHISVAIIGRGAGHSARRSGARFRHVLGSQGYAISEAPNAKTAIELVETEKPDLILLDLGLPGMGGHELLRKWRDDGLDVPVVILSSRVTAWRARRASREPA